MHVMYASMSDACRKTCTELLANAFGTDARAAAAAVTAAAADDDANQEGAFRTAVVAAAQGMQLDASAAWVAKVEELGRVAPAWHGVVVVGGAGAGKSKVIETFVRATNATCAHTTHKLCRFYPMAEPQERLYGHFAQDTHDWCDGIVPAQWRKAIALDRTVSWFVFDGPLDVCWTHSLSSVFAPNGYLRLANTSTLPLAPNLKLLFETDTLAHASPAFVQRLGVVMLPDTLRSWRSVVAAWLPQRAPAVAALLRPLFKKYVANLVAYVGTELSPVQALTPAMHVRTLVDVLAALLDATAASAALCEDEMERLFLFACAWSIGGALEAPCRARFDEQLRTLTSNLPDGSVFDHYVDEMLKWDTWRSAVPVFKVCACVCACVCVCVCVAGVRVSNI